MSPTSISVRQQNVVRVYGAGLSGLVAAMLLSESGFRVEIHERLRTLGGLAAGRPTVHSLMGDPEALQQYIGLPVAHCFQRVEREVTYLYGRRLETKVRHWNCLRGNAPGALDQSLFDEAATRPDIVFRWRSPFTASTDCSDSPTIIATGLDKTSFDCLGIPYEVVEGYGAHTSWAGPPVLFSYRTAYTEPEYAYVASHGSTISAALFARKRPPANEALRAFERDLLLTEGISFPRWKRMKVGVGTRLIWQIRDRLLAGTLAGFIDPFYLSGVSGALVSGRVAALRLTNPSMAERDFARFSRTHGVKRAMRRVFAHPLLPRTLGSLMLAVNHMVPDVGVVRRA